MKARQKWNLLVLNSKGFVNFVMSDLRKDRERFVTILTQLESRGSFT